MKTINNQFQLVIYVKGRKRPIGKIILSSQQQVSKILEQLNSENKIVDIGGLIINISSFDYCEVIEK